ncbi:MAG: IS481 family transposase, partial [Treponema sp.]|nr:IS481 family transposase [Treponema sp.]
MGACTSEIPETAAYDLDYNAPPFFERRRAAAALSGVDRGRPDRRHFELFLQREGVGRRTSPARRLQSDGVVERLRRTLMDEHFRIQGRDTFYQSLE